MNKLVIILAVATAGLAALCTFEWKESARHQAQVAALREEIENKNAQIQELQGAQLRVEQQKRELLDMTGELSDQVRAQQLAAQAAQAASSTPAPVPTNTAPAKPDAGGLGGMLGKMMSDPETKQFIRNQQRVMMDQMYRPLIKQLGLSSEEAAAFKDLLADSMMKGAEKATSLLSNPSATNRAELANSMAAEQKSSEEQIKTFLGEQRYSIYKDYQETVGERAQLNMFRQHNDAGEYPLNDLQVEQLLAFMKDEKRNAAAALGLGSLGQDQAMEAMLSEERGQQLIQVQESANQRVFERARSVLSPDQLQAFAAFQTNQLQMVRMGISMARKLMTPSTPPATP